MTVPAGGTRYLQVTGKNGLPGRYSRPPTSNINYGAGQTASNAVVAKLAANGRIAVTASAASTVDVLVDIAAKGEVQVGRL